MKLNIVLIILYFQISFIVKAQSINSGFTDIDNKLFKAQVSTLDEFMARFNYSRDIDGNPIKEMDSIMRKKYLYGLFEKNLLNTESTELIENFVNYSIRRKVYLSLSDSNWFAILNCNVKYNNKDTSMYLIMKIETIAPKEYKWVICDAKADFIYIEPDTTKKFLISPVENEINFMVLSKITELTPQNISNFAYKEYNPDNLSVFFYLIKNKHLKVNYVKEITYYFHQVDGYTISVKNFERKSYNSGWLINKITTTGYKY